MQHDERAGTRPVHVGLGFEGGRVQDECPRLEVAQLVVGRVDEHRPGEERVVRMVRDDADGDPLLRVCAGEGVDDVEVAVADVRHDLLAQSFEMLLRDLRVDLAPPDAVLRARLSDEELVLGRAAGVHACVHGERAALGEPTVAAFQRMRVELRGGRVPVDGALGLDPVDTKTRA